MLIDDLYDRARTTPSDIWEHLPTLRRLAERCDHVVEMGTRWAVSTTALVAGRPKRLTCYDLDRHEAVSKVEEAAREAGVDFRFVQADVLQVEIEPCDLLFIDTLHTYDQLRQELALHGSKAKAIALHDTFTFGVHGELPGTGGLLDACDEYFRDGWTLAEDHLNNNGLRIYRRI